PGNEDCLPLGSHRTGKQRNGTCQRRRKDIHPPPVGKRRYAQTAPCQEQVPAFQKQEQVDTFPDLEGRSVVQILSPARAGVWAGTAAWPHIPYGERQGCGLSETGKVV